jgi:hypothetical protein
MKQTALEVFSCGSCQRLTSYAFALENRKTAETTFLLPTFTDFYRLLPTCTDFYLKHFVGFQCDAGSAALNTHPKAKRLLGDDSVHEHPGLLVVDSGDPWRDLAAAT